ncbi:MAG: hypothetical protein CMM93_06795 [Rickettsiales bacterium]|nr:hypothetical protein [Rickettsiales bacterium]|tara:strand:- start:1142 stop:1528 length:387 start_codon:yes stop_codon:yes gene_type:complete
MLSFVLLVVLFILLLFLLAAIVHSDWRSKEMVLGTWVDIDSNIYIITEDSLHISLYSNGEYKTHERKIQIKSFVSNWFKPDVIYKLENQEKGDHYFMIMDMKTGTAQLYKKNKLINQIAKNAVPNLKN